ncbi:unnamed protein product [Rhodiola kirilowii]
MAQGSGSAAQKVSVYLLAMALCAVLYASTGAQAAGATYVVGGPGGWTFNTDSWPKGKRFAAGDFLVFNYNPAVHNVVPVNRAGYSRCSAPPRARAFASGKDKIKLMKGQNYFICSIAGHCDSGMKIVINAA